ncbi:V-type proton ATPase subunit D-like [Miscanthus floridulus]|uniref:V-type proton ATPase subunit D-like n=1 Tax=Miscanthus floridulus TaxID=154761 RepID=UPI00345B38F3
MQLRYAQMVQKKQCMHRCCHRFQSPEPSRHHASTPDPTQSCNAAHAVRPAHTYGHDGELQEKRLIVFGGRAQVRRGVARAMAGQGQQRLNVVPTVTTLGMVKARLAGATRGHALLKKSDALTVQFRAILKRIVSAKDAMGDAMRAASLSLAEALYVAGTPLRHVVQQSVSGPARLRVRAHQDNIAGVRLPRFESFLANGAASAGGGSRSASLAGLAGGGQQVAACRAAHARALEVLVELASLQTSFLTLDAAIRTTNRRVNALENVVKPRLENTIAYIRGELDEHEREEFFRLKKIQGYKQRELERQKEAATRYAQEKAAGEVALKRGVSVATAESMLENGDRDEDIIF